MQALVPLGALLPSPAAHLGDFEAGRGAGMVIVGLVQFVTGVAMGLTGSELGGAGIVAAPFSAGASLAAVPAGIAVVVAGAATATAGAANVVTGARAVYMAATGGSGGGSSLGPAAKRGPKTDPTAPHNAKIREVAGQVKDGEVIAGGGTKPERVIPTPDGLKSGRRPDILVQKPDGSQYGINVGGEAWGEKPHQGRQFDAKSKPLTIWREQECQCTLCPLNHEDNSDAFACPAG